LPEPTRYGVQLRSNVGRHGARRYTMRCKEAIMRYRIALDQSDEGDSVSVPGLPGGCSKGSSEREAVENIRDAIREHLSVVDEQLRGEGVRQIEVVV